MIWRCMCRQSEQEYEVGGVTCCCQHTLPDGSLVHRSVVERALAEVLRLARLNPQQWAWSKQHLRVAFDQRISVLRPLAAFEEHSDHIHSILRQWWVLLLSLHLEVIVQQINSNIVFSCIILLGSS